MIGILAYGSLIDDPGGEIWPLITSKIEDVETPFPVEFARTSRTRDGAPTLVPVSKGGSAVAATILVLSTTVSKPEARNVLWRRETRQADLSRAYTPPSNPGRNAVLVKELGEFEGLELVLYISIGANIDDLTPRTLAELAISSARKKAGADGNDGIAYLIAAKRNGIKTPLMPAYEGEILRLTGTQKLEQARKALINESPA